MYVPLSDVCHRVLTKCPWVLSVHLEFEVVGASIRFFKNVFKDLLILHSERRENTV